MLFKSACPKCGGRGKWRSKVYLQWGRPYSVGKTVCHKCGHFIVASTLKDLPVRVTWSPPQTTEVTP